MLTNIFLIKGKTFHDLDQLDIYSYPENKIDMSNKDLVRSIIYGHDHGRLIQEYRNQVNRIEHAKASALSTNAFVIDTPVPQVIESFNIYTICVNGKIIIGLILEEDDNPYDYKDKFTSILNELLNVSNCCSFEDEIDIENLLITIFIDIRRYDDEVIQKQPDTNFFYDELFTKIFLFGLDEAGKSSLVRRLKTGKYDDDFFAPTRRFSIEYVQKSEGELYVIWDMPGQSLFRKKWLVGLQDSNFIIFMIDIANQVRFQEAKEEFWKIITRFEADNIPLIIIGNKIDLLNHNQDLSKDFLNRVKDEIFETFEFDRLNNRPWKFLFASVKTSKGVQHLLENVSDLLTM